MYRRTTGTALQKLPNEILCKIFLTATHQDNSAYETTITPLLLSHVCRWWRELALTTGSLWTQILITFPTSQSQMARSISALARSNTYPLHILLDLRDPSWGWQEASHPFRWQDMESILRLLLPHISRWRRVEVYTDTWAPLFTFLWHTKRVGSASQLEHLSLNRCNAFFVGRGQSFQPESMAQPVQLFNGEAPVLREVVLSGVHVDWSTSPLKGLVELELKYHARNVMPNLGQFLAMLAACPQLTKLAIVGWGPKLEGPGDSTDQGLGPTTLSDQESGSNRIVRLGSLKTFIYGFVDSDYGVRLLSILFFPALEFLSIEDVGRSVDPLQPEDATPLFGSLASCRRNSISFLSSQSSYCCFSCHLSTLTHLELIGIRANQETLARFFVKLSALERLHLVDIGSDTLSALFAPDDFGGLSCPGLVSLEISGNSDLGTLSDLLGTRLKEDTHPFPTTTITLSDAESVSDELRAKLSRPSTAVVLRD